ncbi:MAG: acetyl-CoA C-acyltransferase [Promethearchaeota archaeon]
MKLRDVYIADYLRTPFSRSRSRNPPKDVFSKLRPDELAAINIKAMFEKDLPKKGSSIKPKDVDEFILGTTHFNFEYAAFGGRHALFMAKFPSTIRSLALDRQCGSAQTCASIGYANIAMGYSDVVIAVGPNNATITRGPRAPLVGPTPVIREYPSYMVKGHELYIDDIYDIKCARSMLQTAQKLAEMRKDIFTKEDHDKFSVRSHKLAEKGLDNGFLAGEIEPVMGHEVGDENSPKLIDWDVSIRRGATLEKTANLRGLSTPGWAGGYYRPLMTKKEYVETFGTEEGLVTAGNSCPINAGSAALLLASKEAMDKHNLEPMAKIVSIGFGAVDATVMGRGPVIASQMALKHAGMTTDDIDYFEINEAFAIVGLNWVWEMGLMERMAEINVYGGAIAIGHPISASGPRIAGTLARILKEKKAKYGLSTMCCGGGQGTAILMENLDA